MKLIKAPYVEVTVALEEESETDYDSLIKPIINPENDRNIFKPSGFNVVVDEKGDSGKCCMGSSKMQHLRQDAAFVSKCEGHAVKGC